MTSTPPSVSLVRDALDLRRQLLALLSSVDPGTLFTEQRRESAATWRLLLTAECCALPLAAFLRRHDLLDRLASEPREALRAAEMRESQRVLAARTTIRALEDVGADIGVPLTVLKGGAVVAAGIDEPLDLGDVDVLVDPSQSSRVWDALLARGWSPKSVAITPGVRAARNHFDPLLPPGAGLPIELHQQIHYGDSDRSPARTLSVPMDGWTALHRLPGPTSVVVALRHSVIQHPHRRGHLRDLFLLSREYSTLNGEGKQVVDDALRGDPHEIELRDLLGQARALSERMPLLDSAETTRFVAWKYASLMKVDWVAGELLPGWSGISHLALERDVLRRAAMREQLRYALGRVPLDSPFRTRWSSRAPTAVREGIGWVARATYRLALVALLVALGRRVRRVAERLVSSESPPI
jgi:hypothetical protein